jgi:hypothetical protein
MDKATKDKALDELRMLKGDAPHNGGGNICRGDGYFANSLVRKYGMSISELERAVGYKSDAQLRADERSKAKRLEAENKELREELARIKARGRIVDRIDV